MKIPEPPTDNTHIPFIKRSISRLKNGTQQPLTPAGKKLRAWLIKNKMTIAQFAMRTGFNASTIAGYVANLPNTYPSLAQAFAMEYVTGGFVPAYLWLDNPYIEARVRSSQLSGAMKFETSIKSFVLKFNSLKTDEGMIRHKARILSRMFGVEWGEVKRRCWIDAKERSKKDRRDISHLLVDGAKVNEED